MNVMNRRDRTARTRGLVRADAAAFCVVVVSVLMYAQGGTPSPQLPQTARALAPFDLTGYWVSVITQDWRWRMVPPAKGDYLGVPMNAASKKVADAWDPAKDEAAGEQCKSYGAAAIMGVPGRLRIGWQDDNTLKVETDAGLQTRLLQFSDQKGRRESQRTWQGKSIAQWQFPPRNVPLLLQPARRNDLGAQATELAARGGSLRVATTNLRPGYLRKNGVPYSADTRVLEYWDLFRQRNGDQWLMVTTEIDDPVYLREPRLITYQFKRETAGGNWDPTPCSARW